MVADISVVLFDLDGTLIDHFDAIHNAYNKVQQTFGLPEVSLQTIRDTVGGSLPVTMQRLTGFPPGEQLQEALRIFHECFAGIMFEQVVVFDQVEALLAGLKTVGIKQAVFTNKHGPHARQVLAHLGLDHYFSMIAGEGDTPHRKPQPEFSNWILQEMNATPATTVLVGDSPFDVEAAKVVGMRCYGVTTGTHTAEQMQEAGADAVFPCMRELGMAVFGLPESHFANFHAGNSPQPKSSVAGSHG